MDYELSDLLDEDILYGNEDLDSEFGLDIYENEEGSANILKTTGLVAAGALIGALGMHFLSKMIGSGNQHYMNQNKMGSNHMDDRHMNRLNSEYMGRHHN